MQPTFTAISDDSYEIWMTQNAMRHNLTSSEYHPDNYRKQIKRLQNLINKAEKQDK